MIDVFRFDLPGALTAQLINRLESLHASPVSSESDRRLMDIQERFDLVHGVYLILHNGVPVYAGKADNVQQRLLDHFEKLRGRKNILMSDISFKALLLEVSWSTSANEDLLIEHYKAKGQCVWNNKGFGPKDPGKNRDGHRPGWFDEHFPIDHDWICPELPDSIPVGELLNTLKDQLPFLLRYEVPAQDEIRVIDLREVPRTADGLLTRVAIYLGNPYQLMRFNSHYTLYPLKDPRTYEHGVQLFPASPKR